MYTTKYTVYLADESTIEHHGKAETKAYQLCFTCAIVMATENYAICDQIVDKSAELNFCDRCSGYIPENAK